MGQIDLKDPKAVAAFIREHMAAGLARAVRESAPATTPVKGHEGHACVELPTGGVCHRRVLCQTCEILLIDTFEPASLVHVTLKPEGT
jgi:hypothetical protein